MFDFQKQQEQAVVTAMVKGLAAIESPIASDLALAVAFLLHINSLDHEGQWGRLIYVCASCELRRDCPDAETAFADDEDDLIPLTCDGCRAVLTFKELVISPEWVASL